MKKKIKTIDVNVKEWFDKVNGNSYFSGIITTDYGTKQEKNYNMPFQYGYGEHYIDMAHQQLIKAGIIDGERHANGSWGSLWRYCEDNNIILRIYK